MEPHVAERAPATVDPHLSVHARPGRGKHFFVDRHLHFDRRQLAVEIVGVEHGRFTDRLEVTHVRSFHITRQPESRGERFVAAKPRDDHLPNPLLGHIGQQSPTGGGVGHGKEHLPASHGPRL